MKKLLFGLGLLIPFLLSAQQVPRSLTASNGTFIGFYEYKPPMYSTNTTRKFPLIIFLHGIGERGDGSSSLSAVLNVGIPRNIHYGLTDMQFNYNGSTEGFLVLSPQLSYNYGNWQAFYIQAMVDYAIANLRVDPNRIYLTGLSLGGGGVWNYASSSSNAAKGLAAIAPICGTCDWSNMANIAQQALPVWAFHAMDDGVVGVGCTQAAINSINSYNPIVAPIATYYPTGNHWIWDQVYDPTNPQLYLWFLSKSRGSSSPPPTGGGGNVAPVANAGNAQTVTLPTNSVSLSGSGSYDSDGTITSYVWSQAGGPSTASFTSSNASNTNANGLVQGTYSFKLTVTDNVGSTNSAYVNITVNAAAAPSNTPPVAVTSGNQTLTLPTNSAFLLGSGSYDAGGYITTYAWSQQSGPNTATITPTGSNLDVKNMIAGTYVFKLTVTDNGGATSSANATITVNGTSTPPPTDGGGGGAGAPIAVTSGNQTLTLPTNSAFLLGSGSYDVGGYITNYAWSQSSGPNTASITPMGANLDVKNMIAGTYVFKLTVTDNSGQTGTANATITVNGTSTPPPTGGGGGTGAPFAVATASQTITLPTNSVFLLGSGSYDVGGWITNYAWSQQSGPNTASITPMGSNLDVKNMIAGTYVFKLTVTDNSGMTGSTTTTVTVNGTSTGGGGGGGSTAGSPTAVAGANQYITLPTNSVYLMGGGSYDVGGWVTNFAWSQESGPSTATLTTVNPSNVEARNLVAGTYTFKLTVTDNSGLTGTSTMQVFVYGTSTTKSATTTSTTEVISSTVSTTSPTTQVTTATANSLTLYPNPVTTTMNVEINNDKTGDITINVINSAGTVVKSIKATKSSYTFTQAVNMQDVKAGTYVVEIRFADGTRLSGQVVKQ